MKAARHAVDDQRRANAVTWFADTPLPERSVKPRTTGLSMMIDWGMGLVRQADTLESAGVYVDFAKIAAGIPRLLPRDVLSRKLALYREHGVSTSPGGLFAELAIQQGRFEAFLDECLTCGFDGVEISDNLLDLPAGEKARCIRQAVERGLKVFGEVGKKEGQLDDEAMIDDVRNCLDAGASQVYLEAHELFAGGRPRSSLIERLCATFPPEQLSYELPVVILPDTTRDYKHKVCAWLVAALGTEVNLANIEWDELYVTELVRRGFAGDTSHAGGAYRLAGMGSLDAHSSSRLPHC